MTQTLYYDQYIKYKNRYLILKGGDNNDYPYYKLYYTLTRDKFIGLVNKFQPKILNYIPHQIKTHNIKKCDGKYIFIEENWGKNEELNNVTDIFTEECRVTCRFGKYESPLEYWNKNKNNMKTLSNDKYGTINVNYIRDLMYNKTKLCNNFRITVAITVLQIFNAKRWLDISAGWGDRLIAAIAHNVDFYCGVDPNDCLQPKYKEIIETLVAPEKQKNFMVIHDGFETATLPDKDFDLVFSSPPFFDLEIYSQSKADSVTRYNTVDKWYNEFLITSLRKAYNHLKKDGHMVLYMGEGIHTSYINDMINEMNKLMTYIGDIYYFYPNKNFARTMNVWKK